MVEVYFEVRTFDIQLHIPATSKKFWERILILEDDKKRFCRAKEGKPQVCTNSYKRSGSLENKIIYFK